MPWVRVDDHVDQHPKFAQVGGVGLGLFVAGLAYCNRMLTDGFIPMSVAHRLVDTGELTGEAVAERLVEAGLWDVRQPEGYEVHEYAQYQWTKERIEAERERAKEGMRATRLRRNSGRNGSGNESGNEAVSLGVGMGLGTQPEPEQVPGNGVGTVAEPLAESESDPAVLYDRLTQKFPSPKVLDWLNRLERDHGKQWVSEELLAAYREDRDHLTLLGRTERRLKERAYLQNKPKPQAPEPPQPPPTPEQAAAAAARRKEIRDWLANGGLGSPPPEGSKQ